MKKTAIKLTILSIILLVSISSTALGYASYATNPPNDTSVPNIGTVDVTEVPTGANVTVTENTVQETPASIQGEVVVTVEPISSQETSVPNIPVTTPKSPGFGSVVSVVTLLSAMYIVRRR